MKCWQCDKYSHSLLSSCPLCRSSFVLTLHLTGPFSTLWLCVCSPVRSARLAVRREGLRKLKVHCGCPDGWQTADNFPVSSTHKWVTATSSAETPATTWFILLHLDGSQQVVRLTESKVWDKAQFEKTKELFIFYYL